MKSKHGRKLVIGGVALVRGRVPHDLAVMDDVRNLAEAMMIRTRFLEAAPFEWVGLILRYGIENAETPVFERIDSKHGDLPVAIEVDMKDLQGAEREQVHRVFFEATMKALIGVARRYSLPAEAFERALAEAGVSPGP